MEKNYDFKTAEGKIYQMWEKGGHFAPKIDPKKKPFTILLPPPNASGRMHTGNVLMIAIEDLLIRYHRMKGDPTLWIPGTDHAGTETQITYERELKKEGKSRFNFNREELYKNIWDFVQKNRGLIEAQIRQMGASVDWSRYTYTLDPQVIATVHNTFKKMAKDDLVYRGNYMVNYCPKCGTTYSDVEIKHEERLDPLYYINYELVDKSKQPYITVATVRPEPIFIDTHIAVNPKDKKHAWLIGQKAYNPITHAEMDIIGDSFVDPKFGTGIVKLTPGVDKNDYEVALKHNIPINPVVELNGKMKGRYAGMSVLDGRKKALEELQANNAIEKVDEKYLHSIAQCKAGHDIEPMVLPNWFVKVDAKHKSFKGPALDAVKTGKVKIFPKWREITYVRWMEEMRDWAISRQNVWGIQIPIWYEVDSPEKFNVWFVDTAGTYHNGTLKDLEDQGFAFADIMQGLQRVIAPADATWVFEENKKKDTRYLPETDTFDTWFSSGQWPLVTLGYPDSEDFKYFYPTAVLETGWEIVRLWVSRMIMFGIYLTDEVPFEHVYLHGIVKALDGRKMSKSLGNVINPEEYITEYGVDALRMGLISGTANGKDFAFPKDRVIAYKHFANKIWNMARFMQLMEEELPRHPGKPKVHPESISSSSQAQPRDLDLQPEDKEILKNLHKLIKSVDTSLEKFRMADGAEAIYQFMWHDLADKYIEKVKDRTDKEVALSVLRHVYITSLKLLHPFMPFVTEEIWGQITKGEKPLIIQSWPTV